MSDAVVIRCEHRCQLGEGPLWSARDNAVYWVDILAPAVHRLSLADRSVQSWPMPARTGWIVERRDRPGFIAGLQTGFAELDLDPFVCRTIADPEPDLPDNRMNDATVDHLGRIWAGTMDCHVRAACGSLYCLEPDFTWRRMDDGYKVTNGPVFSVERDRMYHNDTARGIVYCFDVDAAGEIGNRREFLRFADGDGFPDGMAIDADDGLWIAHWGGGRVSRFTADGTLDRSIRLPASQITSCVFAGPELDRMFVTSAAKDCADEPQAGMLFEVDPGVRGLPGQLFYG